MLSSRAESLARKGAALLAAGLSPRELALTLALGAVLGTLPLLWGTTLLCAGAAVVFRLNQGAIQVVNYLVYPLQVMLLVPYYRLGGLLFPDAAGPPRGASAPSAHIADAGAATLKAVCAWALTAPVAVFAVYVVSLALLRRRRRFLSGGSSPMQEV